MNQRLQRYLPGLADSWNLVLLMIFAGSILAYLTNFAIGLIFPQSKGWVEMLTYPLIFVPPLLLILHSTKQSLAGHITPVPVNEPHFGSIGTFLSFTLILPLVFALNYITEPLTMWMGVPEFIEVFMRQIHENKISSLLSVVIMAPLLEELFCRGIILRGLLTHTTPLKAILWSSFIFGIMHLNPWQAIPAFLLGLFMGWIYWKTHSIWSVIYIHFINNGFSYLITILYPELPANTGFYDIVPGNLYYMLFAIALIYSVTVIYTMHKSYDHTISAKI